MIESSAPPPRDRSNRHAGAPADDLPDDVVELAAAATVHVGEEPTRTTFVRFAIAALTCLAVVAFVVVMLSLWAAWAAAFWIPGPPDCQSHDVPGCRDMRWHDWVSSWFGM